MVNNNLPVAIQSFVGRTEEIAEIKEQLLNPQCRLLTLSGAGGIGKTRLAIEVAHQLLADYNDAVFFVDLTPLRTRDDLVTAIAVAMNRELSGEESPDAQLINLLQTARVLLLLDNCEHLLEAVELIQRILEAAPDVKLLATSREVLNLSGEWLYSVSGLAFPDEEKTWGLGNYGAIQLFNERALQINPHFNIEENRDCILRICKLVDGMPLAIELATSWLRLLSCSEIANEIQRGLDIFESSTRNVPERHRSIRAVLGYSWNSLSHDEQSVFSALSVFRGGFTREAAGEVCGASLIVLASLYDKSLLRRNDNGRFTLHELLRQFAREKLDETPGRLSAIRDRHCSYFSRFLSARTMALCNTRREVMEEVEYEIDNIRSFLARAVEQFKVRELDATLEAVTHFFDHRGWAHAGEQFMAETVTMLELRQSEPDVKISLAKALCHHGFFKLQHAQFQEADVILNRSLLLSQELQYQPGIAWTLNHLGQNANWKQENSESTRFFEESIRVARSCNEEYILADSLQDIAIKAFQSGDMETGYELVKESGELFSRIGTGWGIVGTKNILAIYMLLPDKPREARQELLANYELCQQLDIDWLSAETLFWLALSCHKSGDLSEAQSCTEELIMLSLTLGRSGFDSRQQNYASRGIALLAKIAASKGQSIRAVELLTLAIKHQLGNNLQGIESPALLDRLRQDLSSIEFDEAVRRGQMLDLETVANDLADGISDHQKTTSSITGSPESLTSREIEVMELIAGGLDNSEIAAQLVIAKSTVKKHINNIFGKLAVEDRVNAIIRARESGLIE